MSHEQWVCTWLSGGRAGQEVSPVTTSSDVQAMAVDLPGGLGTPAVAGVLILAALGALVLRSHMFLRTRVTAPAAQKAAEADTVETSTSSSSR